MRRPYLVNFLLAFPLSAVLFGNTLVNAAAAALYTVRLRAVCSPILPRRWSCSG